MFEQENQNGYEDLYTHMQTAQQTDLNDTGMSDNDGAQGGKRKKKKREKKAGNGMMKSAVNGLIFGACASLVFSGVVAVGNRTFLKPEESKETLAPVIEESTAKIETTLTAEDGQTEDKKTDGMAQQTSALDYGAMAISQIVQKCMPSVVSITTKGIEEVRGMFGTQQYESEGAGSGIIVGQNDTELLIATNNHVVSGAQEVSVCFDDSSEDAVVAAKVKGTDASNDLAIVAVDLADMDSELLSNIKIASIGDSESLSVGDQVVAIGNALGYGQSVTTGIVSALDREVTIDSYTATLIQTDAAINPGNSGGALLNMKGELVGINSAKFAASAVEGMGYAIPITTAQPILQNLMNRETREPAGASEAGFLGVSCQDVSEEATQYYGIPAGAYIASVEEGGAAAAAGIQKGDIITKFDGLSIGSSSELKSTIAYYKKGETVEVVFMRSNNGEYKENTVSVTLAASAAAAQESNEEKKLQLDPYQDQEQMPDDNYGNGDYDDFFGGDGIRDFFERFYGDASGSSSDMQQESGNQRGR